MRRVVAVGGRNWRRRGPTPLHPRLLDSGMFSSISLFTSITGQKNSDNKIANTVLKLLV
jgi:hypothetical protein